MQEVVILQPHTEGRLAADMLRDLCILQWRSSWPLWRRISGFFHRILAPDFPPIILRRRKHLRSMFCKSRWYKGFCEAIKKPVSEGWTGAIKQNGVAVFVPKFAFSGEGSSLQRCRFLLTENLYFCAFLPQNAAQLMKTAPRVTLTLNNQHGN